MYPKYHTGGQHAVRGTAGPVEIVRGSTGQQHIVGAQYAPHTLGVIGHILPQMLPAPGVAYGSSPGLAYGSAGAAPAAAGGPQVVQRTGYDMREFTLGFPLTTVATLATTLIISRPQVPFRGERLVVPASTASYFSINDVKVGNKSQLVNENALPAEMFSQLGVGVRQTFDTAQVSQDVSISVTNNDVTTRSIQPAIVGTAAN